MTTHSILHSICTINMRDPQIRGSTTAYFLHIKFIHSRHSRFSTFSFVNHSIRIRISIIRPQFNFSCSQSDINRTRKKWPEYTWSVWRFNMLGCIYVVSTFMNLTRRTDRQTDRHIHSTHTHRANKRCLSMPWRTYRSMYCIYIYNFDIIASNDGKITVIILKCIFQNKRTGKKILNAPYRWDHNSHYTLIDRARER